MDIEISFFLIKKRNDILKSIFEKTEAMLSKERVLKIIKDMPDNFQLDDLVERLIILEKFEIGMQQIEDGKIISSIVAKERLKKWIR